jgi:hypothetical protein
VNKGRGLQHQHHSRRRARHGRRPVGLAVPRL